jgi:hypothetical protein
VYDSDYGLYAAFTMYIITHEFNNIGQGKMPKIWHVHFINRYQRDKHLLLQITEDPVHLYLVFFVCR